MLSKDLWLIEYEQIGEDLCAERIDLGMARSRLKSLGFDADEINCHLDAILSEPADA